MNPTKQIEPAAMVTSEQSIRFDFGTTMSQEVHAYIQQFCQLVETNWSHLIDEAVPSYQTVTVFFLKDLLNPQEIIKEILTKWNNRTSYEFLMAGRHVQIPVCYDAIFSEDMTRIIEHTGLTREEVISLHTSTLYTVHMIGFLPGFPYLGGLPEVLHMNRLNQPRLCVPKGAVGIGGSQTGIYPIESPGGWNILGRTPIDLFRPEHSNPFLIRSGDRLSFISISCPRI